MARLSDGAVQQLGYFGHPNRLGRGFADKVSSQQIRGERDADQLLANPVMKFLTKARLLAIAHFNNFLFQSLAFGDVLGYAGNAIYLAQFVANRERPVMNPMDDPLGRDNSILFVI